MSDRTTFASEFLRGMRMFAPIAVSVAAYGLVWGVLARQAGMSVGEAAMMSGGVFAGSSQFVALELWTPGALPVGAIILSAAIINLRFVLMSGTLRPLFDKTPRWQAALAMFFVADENWALVMGEMAKGRATVAFYLGTGALAWPVWLASTLSGRLLGSVINDPRTYGLDFAFTVTFIALLLGMWKGRTSLLPWIVGGLVAIVVAKLLPGTWYIIAGGLVGSLAGALAETHKARSDVA